ncbi:adenine-specific DNA-methyltransferase [Dyadobacter sp. BE34]|uniref:Adenine-specific DNA-methyltransferase n=1 Tax=Dyadobacter fermentans TaxID=94254 RepID=A0ABU1R8K9_9BACT|nr:MULTISPECIES: DNA adenine methylase [Dyadobacter]MDR6809751.1 adenine-specific DNA-methyltransferase [Dyadobacter fermentans]MDR7047534.1 adenine-specific DNA-methyltransferase [Dyadobacter sp. BE242]MDR7201704.1 adenine-specific DNA-methyltransferase [Dyadobacter sp. BE34]MDR7219574.1 adenine-specific DNA-methyltransferase [Dyadobacter sp. BE31]MDR7267303.1 adenine-specific DNA-methyltransferase [Dyadobacter sp. BE32]
MGSKRGILEHVVHCIDNIYDGGIICDLFAGTSILSGALGGLVPMHSNDIQEYSSVLANTYLSGYNSSENATGLLDNIEHKFLAYIDEINETIPNVGFVYSENMSIENFVFIEKEQQNLIHQDFSHLPYHLFIKYYSGTYWSFEQCISIDALRRVADDYGGTRIYYLILSSLIYAMSYCSQSTGHYAQYRDANAESSKEDILTYRQRNIFGYFRAKFNQLAQYGKQSSLPHKITTLDYRNCLETIEAESLIYADPPYAFVHYSRFYHALETLVKYDYPNVAHKGRYRSDRHQSPFGQKTQVKEAFESLFYLTSAKRSNLILSYSNTGMISLTEIIGIAQSTMNGGYDVKHREVPHTHSTMGRNDDKNREVKEYLVTITKR